MAGALRAVVVLVFQDVLEVLLGFLAQGLEFLVLHRFDLLLQMLNIDSLSILQEGNAVLPIAHALLQRLLQVALFVGSVDAGDVVEVVLLLNWVDIRNFANSLEVVTLHQAETLVVVDQRVLALHSLMLVRQPELREVGTLVAESDSLELARINNVALLLVMRFGSHDKVVFLRIL